MLPLLLAFLSIVSADCLPVTGDRILVRDIAQIDPAFQAIPQDTVVGFAPLPGSARTLTRTDLASFARAHHVVPGELQDVCVSIPLAGTLSAGAVVASMRAALPPEAAVSIVELSKAAVPVGDVVFPRESLEPPQPADPTIQNWRGFVRYGGNRRFAIWARVHVTLELPVVVVTRSLRAGEILTADSIATQVRSGPLRADRVAGSAAEVVGRTLIRAMKAGDAVPIAALEKTLDIRRGDAVNVEVLNGSTRLVFSAVAEANARKGDAIQLRNPASGKTFRAHVTSSASAVVTVGKP